MDLYLYNTGTKHVVSRIEGVLSYTDQEIVTEDAVYGPLADSVELSATPDCAETLRADWRRDNPSAESRLEELENLVAALLFGGEPV